MRLPSVSLAFALGLLTHLPPGTPEAGAAPDAPARAVGCVERAGASAPEAAPPPAARPAPVPTPLDARGLAVERSYAAVFRILSEENRCSRFFGGPAKATEAFNQFARRLNARPLRDRLVAIRMSGAYAYYQSNSSGAFYRLFEEATLNLDGPLGPDSARPASARMMVGSFPAHTAQGRALILLHELGHLVQGPDGDWLLPNDGSDYALSARNSKEVEAHCVEQLRAVPD